MKNFSPLLQLSVLVSTLLFSSATATLAAEHVVVPLAFNLNVEKRDIISETITLTNNSGQMVRLYATVNEVATDGAGVVESFLEPSNVDRTNSPTSWIEINRSRIELAPGEQREVPFTIRMNPNTAPGDYSVFIGFASGSNQPEATAKVMAGQAPGTLVNLVVDKKQDQFLRLEKFTVDKFVTGRGDGEVSFTIHNPGSVDVVPKGEVIFYDAKGNEVRSAPINVENIAVVRDASTEFSVLIPNDLGIGKHKAYLSVEYGEYLTDSLQDTAYFYVTPLRQIIILFVSILVLSVGVALYVHRRYSVDIDDSGAESVAVYVREGRSVEVHHDIDLSKAKPTAQQEYE